MKTATVIKSWKWSGSTANGWKALVVVTEADGTQQRKRVLVSRSESVVPLIDETIAAVCDSNNQANWDLVLNRFGGSVSPAKFFPGAAMQVAEGVEELWNES